MSTDQSMKFSANIRPKYYADEATLAGVESQGDTELVLIEDYFLSKAKPSITSILTRAKLKGFELLPRGIDGTQMIALVYDLGEPTFYLWICSYNKTNLGLNELKKIDIGSADIIWMKALKSPSIETIRNKAEFASLEFDKMNKESKKALPSTVLYLARPNKITVVFFQDSRDEQSIILLDLSFHNEDIFMMQESLSSDAITRSRHDFVEKPPVFFDKDAIEHFGKGYHDQLSVGKKHNAPSRYKSSPLFDVALGKTVFVSQELSPTDPGYSPDAGPFCVVISDPLGFHVHARIVVPQSVLDSLSPNKGFISSFFKSSASKGSPDRKGLLLPSCQHISLSASGDLLSLFDFEGRNFYLYQLKPKSVELYGVYNRGNSDGLVRDVMINTEGGYVVVGSYNHETIHIFQLDTTEPAEPAPPPETAGTKAFGITIPSWKTLKDGVSGYYSAGNKSRARFKRKLGQEIEIFVLGSGMLMLALDGNWMGIDDKQGMLQQFSKPIEHLDIVWTNNVLLETGNTDFYKQITPF